MTNSFGVIIFRRTRRVVQIMYQPRRIAVSPNDKVSKFFPDELARREFVSRLNTPLLGFSDFFRPNTKILLSDVGPNTKMSALTGTIVGKRKFATEALYRQSIAQKVRRVTTGTILGLTGDAKGSIDPGKSLAYYLPDLGSQAEFRRKVLEAMRKYVIAPIPSTALQGQVKIIMRNIYFRCT